MRLGIYMGSFNPVHKGHIKIVRHLLKKQYVDKVLIVPTLNYWDKQDLADVHDRINMLKLYESNDIIIDTIHNEDIYTYDLISKLEKMYPTDTLYLIIGADNLVHFDQWKNYHELLKYPMIIFQRNNIKLADYIKKYPANHFIIVNDFKEMDISSTKIRSGQYGYLDKKIIKYINEKGLYGARKNNEN